MAAGNHSNRRQFLKGALGSAVALMGFPVIVPSVVLGRSGKTAPSNRITVGCLGVGWQGTSNMEDFLRESDARVIAVCDVDANHLKEAKWSVDRWYGNKDCRTFHDFREMIARDDIDVLSIGLPDHWHAIPAIEAAKSNKDIYGEKPLSHSLVEGRAMCNAVKEYDRIWQTGSWQRSQQHFRFACELVLNGRIGKVSVVEVGLPSGHTDFEGTAGQERMQDPPDELDYDFWLGPAPYAPYAPARVHKNWRWNLDYGGGQLMDWVGHHVDIAHWGLGLDYSGPVEVVGTGVYPRDGLWNSATTYWIEATYENGLKMIIAGGYPQVCDGHNGTKWIGEYGWVRVDRQGVDAFPQKLLQEKFGPEEVHLFHSPGHIRNFLDCVKSRQQTITPCEVAHRSATPGHLGQIAVLLGRKIRFGPHTEEIIGDPTAARMLGNSMRSPWHL
jgi:predicted dehydrogenase